MTAELCYDPCWTQRTDGWEELGSNLRTITWGERNWRQKTICKLCLREFFGLRDLPTQVFRCNICLQVIY